MVDVEASERLALAYSAHVIAVSESGLKSRAGSIVLRRCGYRAFLIGERFMTDPDPAGAILQSMGSEVIFEDSRRLLEELSSENDLRPHMFVKVCGITRVIDALHAVEQGATAIGFVFWPQSPRAVRHRASRGDHQDASVACDDRRRLRRRADRAGSARWSRTDAASTAVQLHGDEPPAYADARSTGRSFAPCRSIEIGEASEAWSEETALLLDNIDPVRRGRDRCGGRLDAGGGRLRRSGAWCWRAA